VKPYLVYQLVDPRDGKPFYIGSGKRGRPYEHFTMAANGKPGRKNDRIRELQAIGLLPTVETLLECEWRDWAYECEATLIRSTGGLLNDQGMPKKPIIDLSDELFACMKMEAKHRLPRMMRLLKHFPEAVCKRYGMDIHHRLACKILALDLTRSEHGKA